MFYPRKTVAQVDLKALAHNFAAIKNLVAPQTKLMTVVKANAYGHGAVPIAQELEKLGTDFLGVACVYEVIELRKYGIKLPIFNMGPTFIDEAAAVFEYDYIPTVFSLDLAKKISEIGVKLNKIAQIHIKVNTGMNRLGVALEDFMQLIFDIKKLPNIKISGLYTHFADADTSKSEATKNQLQKFQNILQQLNDANIKIDLIHASNSAGTLFWPDARFNLVRVGMALYGYSPSDDEQLNLPVKLKPIMALKTYISFIKKVRENTPISYGLTFVTKKESTIATLAIGYADGLRRAPYNCEEVLAGGKKAAILGRVCMDQTMIDVSEIEGLQIGDEVAIIGKQGYEEISAFDVAKRTKTSVYEVLTSIAARVERVYLK